MDGSSPRGEAEVVTSMEDWPLGMDREHSSLGLGGCGGLLDGVALRQGSSGSGIGSFQTHLSRLYGWNAMSNAALQPTCPSLGKQVSQQEEYQISYNFSYRIHTNFL